MTSAVSTDPPTQRALDRALRSLLRSELAAARGRRGGDNPHPTLPERWSNEARITGRRPIDLGCDSLEALWLSSAVCEMFGLAKVNRHHTLASSDTYGEWLDIVASAWADGQHALTFSTSGSTGRSKRCTHAYDDLDAEVRYLAEVFAGSRRVLAFVPAHHIYGFLFTALLPDVLGVDVLDGDAAVEALASLRSGDLVVAFPERWSWIERVVDHWPLGVRGVTSTAPCPRDLIDALAAAGLSHFTEVYGSTETGGIAVRAWPSIYYQLMPRWHFAAGDDALIDRKGRRFPLPDIIERQGAHDFIPAGRRDGAVQVGGVNVQPEHVAAVLRDHPGVVDVAIRLMRPGEGSRLKAFVVIERGLVEEEVRLALETWVRTNLEVAARPCSWSFGQQLPRTMLGKSADW